jgi:hypothetical protein|tara:strand:- start:78 stop:248 length:171 start_codon:yes stop_codon:yes gene_type:complete
VHTRDLQQVAVSDSDKHVALLQRVVVFASINPLPIWGGSKFVSLQKIGTFEISVQF